MSANEYGSGKPVALLARAGMAREKLRAGVSNAGGLIVLEESPEAMDVQVLLDAAPQIVVVALEPAVEDALERLDDVLQSPGMTLIFEEAEVAARREGWEEQRWVRHLSAKLNGHDNVLPPGEESHGADPVAPAVIAAAPESAHESAAEPEPVMEWTPPVADASAEPVPSWEDIVALEGGRTDQAQVAPAAGPAAEHVLADTSAQAAVAAAPPPLPEAPAYRAPDFSSWALVTDEELVAQPAPAPAPAAAPSAFLSGALSLMELEDDGAGKDGAAAVFDPARRMALVLAGIGGPDAVRRVLAELPGTFSAAVLVQMRLDGGRYDNLVKQMGRVTELPVVLAERGEPVNAGHVYILADDVGIARDGAVWRFAEATPEALIAALPGADAALLMLSGAEVGAVQDALAFARRGGFVGGQTGGGCYAPEAANQLAAAGMESGTAEELSQALVGHWID